MSGALFAKEAVAGSRQRLTKGIILTDDVDLFDASSAAIESVKRVHLDVGVGVKAEVPEVALVVCQAGSTAA